MPIFTQAQYNALKTRFIDDQSADPSSKLDLEIDLKGKFLNYATQTAWQKYVIETANRLDRAKREDNLNPAPRQGMSWTITELQTLAYHEAQKTTITNIARILERSEYAVRCKLGEIDGILRDPRIDYYKSSLTATQIGTEQEKQRNPNYGKTEYPLVHMSSYVDPTCQEELRKAWSAHTTPSSPNLFKPTKELQMKIEQNVVLINGSRAENYTDDQIFELINTLESQITNLEKTKNKPEKLVAKIKSIEGEIQTLVKIVDARPKKAS